MQTEQLCQIIEDVVWRELAVRSVEPERHARYLAGLIASAILRRMEDEGVELRGKHY